MSEITLTYFYYHNIKIYFIYYLTNLFININEIIPSTIPIDKQIIPYVWYNFNKPSPININPNAIIPIKHIQVNTKFDDLEWLFSSDVFSIFNPLLFNN